MGEHGARAGGRARVPGLGGRASVWGAARPPSHQCGRRDGARPPPGARDRAFACCDARASFKRDPLAFALWDRARRLVMASRRPPIQLAAGRARPASGRHSIDGLGRNSTKAHDRKLMIRAAAHVHSDWSYDGSWTVVALAQEFGKRGYDVLLMTEHDRGFDQDRWQAYRQACVAASQHGALIVPGIEYSDSANLAHVAVWGDVPFLGEGRPTKELLADAASKGGAAMFAHPGRREAWRQLDDHAASLLVGIEVWNRKYDGWAPGRLGARLCEGRPELVPFFGLDFHTRRQLFPLGMLIDVDPPGTAEAVVSALLGRRCRPVAFGVGGHRLIQGPGYGLARSAEASRRFIRPAVRRWRRFRNQTSG